MWWTEDGNYVLSSHSDGSYCRWMVDGEDENEEEEKSDIPYGKKEKLSLESFAPSGIKCIFLIVLCFFCRSFPLQGHF